ncbi:alpha/beta fold hydrolase [Ornithinimicrobium sp. W1679]|uniref:alpha/beta fold hydrolase n=1 Tax=Ornithinimicrobium sp. W1679 TaxID=3418770 RepID=UPI003CFAF1A5
MQWRPVVQFEHDNTLTDVRRLGPDTDLQYVLVHGIGVGHHYLVPLAEALAGHGRTERTEPTGPAPIEGTEPEGPARTEGSGGVHVLELPGFGGTPTPPEPLTIEELAAVVVAYVRETGLDRPVLVGHSMGAQVVIEAALQAPHLAGPVVSIGGVVDHGDRSPLRQGLRLLADFALETPAANLAVFRDYVRTGPRRFLETVPTMLDYPTEEAVLQLQSPLLVVRGSRDPVARHDEADQLARLAPVGRLVEIPGAHVVMFTSPDAVAEEIVTHALGRDASDGRTPEPVDG